MGAHGRSHKVRHIDGEIRRSDYRILSAKNGASQILKTIASWPEGEMPRGRNRKMKMLEKVLKQIRDPKYGITLRAIGFALCNNTSCPVQLKPTHSDHTGETREFTYQAMKTARGLLIRLKKSNPEGLRIVLVKYKDQVLGITEYKYLNGFWDDALVDTDIKRQLDTVAKIEDGLKKKERRLQDKVENAKKVEAEANLLMLSIDLKIACGKKAITKWDRRRLSNRLERLNERLKTGKVKDEAFKAQIYTNKQELEKLEKSRLERWHEHSGQKRKIRDDGMNSRIDSYMSFTQNKQ